MYFWWDLRTDSRVGIRVYNARGKHVYASCAQHKLPQAMRSPVIRNASQCIFVAKETRQQNASCTRARPSVGCVCVCVCAQNLQVSMSAFASTHIWAAADCAVITLRIITTSEICIRNWIPVGTVICDAGAIPSYMRPSAVYVGFDTCPTTPTNERWKTKQTQKSRGPCANIWHEAISISHGTLTAHTRYTPTLTKKTGCLLTSNMRHVGSNFHRSAAAATRTAPTPENCTRAFRIEHDFPICSFI